MNEINAATVNLLVREARAEQAKLRELLDKVRNRLCDCKRQAGDSKGQCLVKAVRKLQKHIEAHFAFEEQGGWLEEAVIRAPHLAHQLTLLEREHEPLRRHAAELVKMAETFGHGDQVIDELRDQFECFAERLLQHEADEDRMLAEGFNEELDLE